VPATCDLPPEKAAEELRNALIELLRTSHGPGP
jgi:hypothetical protein